MLNYIQDCPCTNTIHATVIISTDPQLFCYISHSTSSYEAASIRTSLYFKRFNLNITTERMKSDIHNNSASTSRHGTEDNSGHIKLCTNIIFGIIVFW